jgi:hypothetical protein
MEFIGEIVSEPHPPGINKQRWIDLIHEHPNLVAPEPRQGINPFTKKPTVIQPRIDVARVVRDGKEMGLMSWAEDESNLINVFGEAKAVVPRVQTVWLRAWHAHAATGRWVGVLLRI